MDDLIARIRAAIDEDERIAKAATPGPWWHNPLKQWLGPEAFEKYDLTKGEEFVGYGDPHPFTGCIAVTGRPSTAEAMNNAAHIARNDPARVLRQVAAYRKILELHRTHDEYFPEFARAESPDRSCVGCGFTSMYDESVVDDINKCPVLLALAEGYGIEVPDA